MPRELTHWTLLERASQSSEIPLIRKLFLENRELFYLGAMLPDAPFFHRGGGGPGSQLADVLHGEKGEDTFAIVRGALVQLEKEQDPLMAEKYLALLFGYTSHLVCDWTFHPMVYFFTGNYYARDKAARMRAQTAHRLFETHLDANFIKSSLAYHSLREVLNCTSLQVSEIGEFMARSSTELAGLFAPELNLSQVWTESIADFARIQRLLINPAVGFLFQNAARLFPSFGLHASLTRYRRNVPQPFFARSIYFRHPVSGESLEYSVDQLLNIAKAETSRVWEDLMDNFRSSSANLAGIQGGKSLNTGMPGVPVSEMRVFDSGSCELGWVK